MRRREFIAYIGGAAAWPLTARAQQPAMPVIGWLGVGSLQISTGVTPFRQGLRDAGFVEGQNVAIEYRFAENYERLPALAAELVNRKVALIYAATTSGAI